MERFQLLGGGVSCDSAGLPIAQLAGLLGITDFGVMARTDQLLPTLMAFLDARMPEDR